MASRTTLLYPCPCGKPVEADCGTARCSDSKCIYHDHKVSHLYWQNLLRDEEPVNLRAGPSLSLTTDDGQRKSRLNARLDKLTERLQFRGEMNDD